MIDIKKRSGVPVYEQIYLQIREGIVEGTYEPSSKLPSIRNLAHELSLSRNTVESAYKLLLKEGFVASVPGSGYRVETPENLRDAAQLIGITKATWEEGPSEKPSERIRYDFAYGDMQPGSFPALQWRKAVDNVLLSCEADSMNRYHERDGLLGLRSLMCRRLKAHRGIECTPEQIVLANGTQAGIYMLLRLFDPKCDAVAMEDPGYDATRHAFENGLFKTVPCGVWKGEEGFLADVRESNARILYVTPANQFPTGRTMRRGLRRDLLRWADEEDAYIFEDDYSHEFMYRKRPIAPLASFDANGRVVYMGTFSKSLSPALRMSYLVIPKGLMGLWDEKHRESYPTVPWLDQATLLDYMKSEQFDRHLWQMQNKNALKFHALMAALEKTMEGRIEVLTNAAGLHVLVRTLDSRGQDELIDAAAQEGVKVYPTLQYWDERSRKELAGKELGSYVLVGFSAIAPDDVIPGVHALARAWFG